MLIRTIQTYKKGRGRSRYVRITSVRYHGNSMLGIPIWWVRGFYRMSKGWSYFTLLCSAVLKPSGCALSVSSPSPTSPERFNITVQSYGRNGGRFDKSQITLFSLFYFNFQGISAEKYGNAFLLESQLFNKGSSKYVFEKIHSQPASEAY